MGRISNKPIRESDLREVFGKFGTITGVKTGECTLTICGHSSRLPFSGVSFLQRYSLRAHHSARKVSCYNGTYTKHVVPAGAKDFVFIDFEDVESCERAIEEMNNRPFDSYSSGPMKVMDEILPLCNLV